MLLEPVISENIKKIMNSNTNDKIIEEKKIQYYAANCNAWFNTKLERDKTLITLSTGAIGLLVTLITTVGTSELFILVSYIFAIILFMTCSVSVIIILDKNAKHIEASLKNRNETNDSLKYLDIVALYSFIIGIVFSLIIGLSTGIDKYAQIQERIKMSQSTEIPISTGRSFHGSNNLSPSPNTNTQNNNSQSNNSQSVTTVNNSNTQSQNSNRK